MYLNYFKNNIETKNQISKLMNKNITKFYSKIRIFNDIIYEILIYFINCHSWNLNY